MEADYDHWVAKRQMKRLCAEVGTVSPRVCIHDKIYTVGFGGQRGTGV